MKKFLVIFVYSVLTLSTLLVFWQVSKFDFVNYDDNGYVYENLHVLNGLTTDNIIWAFTTCCLGYWQPLTWLSLILNCQLFGPEPGWFHLVNVFLHLANTLLLFAVLKKMTGSLWPSAFVAAAFALHPMHVESVAWIAERKDVLSALFWMLTLLAYVSYVKRPAALRYLVTITIFAFGLMAKPMLVTLPFVLLLLDYWPLNRFTAEFAEKKNEINSACSAVRPGRRLLIEKIPFFVLSAVSSVITFLTQQAGGVIVDTKTIPLTNRVGNVFLSYAAYMGKMFWPQNLAVHYPFNAGGSVALGQFLPYALLLVGVSFLVLVFWRTRKYLLVGWFWFVGTLIPVIGLVQFTGSSYADRFTYIPYIGLFIMIAWGLSQLLSKWPQRKIALGSLVVIVLTTLGISAHQQVSYWSNSIALFSHALEVTQNNDVAYNNRGFAYLKLGRSQEAIEDCSQAIRIKSDFVEAHSNRGAAYIDLGRCQEAIEDCSQAIKIKPDFADAYSNRGAAYIKLDRLQEAIEDFNQAIRLKPTHADAHNNLAWIFATSPDPNIRNPSLAISLAQEACNATNFMNPAVLDTLAAAYASKGRFTDAVETAQKALGLANSANQTQVKNTIECHLIFYKQNKPYVESVKQVSHDVNNP